MKNTNEEQLTLFSSNAIRLKTWEWLVAAGIMLILAVILPPVWQELEGFSSSADYRIPYDQSEDYWLFKQLCRSESDKGKTLVIGDSVIWGHYVERNGTLSHFLNEQDGEGQFVNLGLDGSHPMALLGLIKHYGKAVKDEKIILHMNLLWLSSEEADLQTEKEFPFNHPRLVPQFRPKIPCYAESTAGRIGIILERFFPIQQLIRHIQVTRFDNTGLQLWTVENPYSNPLSRITIKPLQISEETKTDTRTSGGQILQSLPWVELETSLQWWAFLRLVDLIISRGNDIFVIIGPLNEHVLDPDSLQKYQDILNKAESRLEEINVPFSLLPLLPEHLYADTSHPISEGYELLAQHIWDQLKDTN
jgi:hypothetical protein